MKKELPPETFSYQTIELYQPNPNARYSLDATAHISGLSRRSILLFCKAGLVHPEFQSPFGIMEFTEETIYLIRKVETLRISHGLDLSSLKIIFDLIAEVNRLKTEVKFLRSVKKVTNH